MFVKTIKLENFRCFRLPTKVVFEEHSLIVGPNGIGKTAIISALRLLLGRERMYRELEEFDWPDGNLFGDEDQPLEIRLSAVLMGFTQSDEDVLGVANGGIVLRRFDTATNELTDEDFAGDYSLAGIEIGFAARYDEATGEFAYKRYFKSDNLSPFDTAPPELNEDQLRHIGMYFVPSARTWEQALSFSSSTFVKLMKEEKALPGDHSRRVRDQVAILVPKVSDAPQLRKLLDELKTNLEKYVPVDGLGFETTRLTMLDIEKSQWLFAQCGDTSLPIAQRGSGFVSLLNLQLILKFVSNRVDSGRNVILLLEEPELHLYPQIQREIVASIVALNAQSISTTHSPELAKAFPFASYIPLQRDATGKVYQPNLEDLRAAGKNTLKRLAYSKRAQVIGALMGSGLLLVEGITDEFILAGIASMKAPGFQGSRGIAVLSFDSDNIADAGQALHKATASIVILVDGDSEGDTKAQSIRNANFKDNIPTLLLQWQRPTSGADSEIEDVMVEDFGTTNTSTIFTQVQQCATAKPGSTSLLDFLKRNKANLEVYECILAYLAETPTPLPRIEGMYSKISQWLESNPGAGLTEIKV